MLSEACRRFLVKCTDHGFSVLDGVDLDKACKVVTWNLTQRDPRYTDKVSAIYLDTFIRNQGVLVDKTEVKTTYPEIQQLIDSNIHLISSPRQVTEKAIMTIALQRQGYALDGYEIDVAVGRADLTARKGSIYVIGECSMCRIDKVIGALDSSTSDETCHLWHVPKWCYHGEPLAECSFIDPDKEVQTLAIYIYKKGPNWEPLDRLAAESLL